MLHHMFSMLNYTYSRFKSNYKLKNHRYFNVNSKENLKNQKKMIRDLNSYLKQKIGRTIRRFTLMKTLVPYVAVRLE